MVVRITDIAKALGLSEATVSLALNNKEVVNYKTRQRVQETAKKMGYSPNVMARNLVNQKNSTIGIIVTDISNAYFGEFAKSCEKAIRKYDYNPLFASSYDKYYWEEKIIEQFISQRVAGVIIVPTAQGYCEINYLEKLQNFGIRYVFATSYYNTVDVPYVMVNLEKGAYQSVKYLLDMGHREIYFLSADPQMVPTLARINGYKRAFEERGLTMKPECVISCTSQDIESGYNYTMNLLKSKVSIDAILTMNDGMAIGSMRAMLDYGVRIPDDISLIGCDDIIYSQVATIPLTTVKQDISAIGRKSVDMLIRMIKNEQQTNEKVLIEPEMIVRSSSGVCKNYAQYLFNQTNA